MTNTRKFSQFTPATLTESVGLAGSSNARGTGGGGGGASLSYTFTQATAVVPALYLGAAVRVDVATGLWNTTLATTVSGAEFYGFITAIVGTTYTVQFAGVVPTGIPAFTGLIAGTPYYLSDTVAGGISATPPAIVGEVNLPVLWVMDNGNCVIKMSRGYVEGGSGGGGGGGGGPSNNTATVVQPGNTFALGDALYCSADNTFSKADAYSGFNAAQAEWVVTSIVIPNNTFTIQQGGKISGLISTDDAGMAIASGIVYYISATAGQEGKLTPTEPVGAGLYSKPFYIQQVQSSNTGWILDQRSSPATVPVPPFIVATGGIITTVGNRKIHEFDLNGTFQITSGSGVVDYLIIAGGGGGGGGAGGGGAGGYLTGTTGVLTVGAFPVVVGAGGAGGVASSMGTNGGNSSFNGVTSTGGGGGGSYFTGPGGGNGAAGGSGGGAGWGSTGGAASAGQGNAGGNSVASFAAAGGGGAGGVGGIANTNNGGNGGPGATSSITGAPVTRAGGGGGGGYTTAGGVPGVGLDGGGNGGPANSSGTAATANTGSGGGGGSSNGTVSFGGGAGGSGVVILSYVYM